jgi:ABC-type transport system substrate-binding protein
MANDLYPITKAVRLALGVTLHNSTIIRWVNRGIKSKSGERIRLKAKVVAGRYFTTQDDVIHFNDRVNSDCGRNDITSPRTPKQTNAAYEKARKRLESLGLTV